MMATFRPFAAGVGPGAMGVVGVIVGGVLMGGALLAADGNPTVFLTIGEASPEVAVFAEARFGPVVLVPELGHDGRFFLVQASDPWITRPELYRTLLDRPMYRAGRVVYPLFARGFGLLPVSWLPWTLPIANVLALGLGTWVTARLSQRLGLSPLFGLTFLANPGMIFAFSVSGAGIIALAFGLWGVDALYRGKWGFAAGVLSVAVLAREVMILTAIGVGAWLWRRSRLKAITVVGVPGLVLFGWNTWVWARLGPDGSARASIDWPFVGLVQAADGWFRDPGADLAMGLLVIAAGIAVAVAAFRRPGYLSWGSVGFVLLAPMLSRPVWQQEFDVSRALAPVLTAAFLLCAVALRRWGPDGDAGSTQERSLTVEDMP